jgi:peptide-methionine (S)-S-oxide reductase
MFMFKKKLEMPSAAEALPGRSTPIPTAREHFVLHRPIKGPYPAGLETAVFGLGCFWGAERKFWELGEGIYATAVGYAGGHTPNPTYEEVCSGRTGHNEVVLVVYDPKKVSYERLLKTFWESHDPTQGMRQGNDVGTQYRSGIYAFTAEQRKATRNSRRAASMPSPPRSSMPLRSISPRITTSNIWRRTRWDIVAWAAPA